MAIFPVAGRDDDDPEIAYYRAVEDLFAGLRGVPHQLSPKDMQLLRSWWRDRVPLSAVTCGLSEVVTRRRQQDEDNPVVSLSYCRHAVRRHAKRLAEASVGGPGDAVPTTPVSQETAASVDALVQRLRLAAAEQEQCRPRVAEAISNLVEHVAAAAELPETAVEEHLYSLEIALLESCRRALDEQELRLLETRAQESTDSLADGETPSPGDRKRLLRAAQDREVRRLLSLPHLEVGPER